MTAIYLPGQQELPQTQASSQQYLAAKSSQLIKANKPQLPCDIGLFSDEANQLDLIEMFMEPTNDP